MLRKHLVMLVTAILAMTTWMPQVSATEDDVRGDRAPRGLSARTLGFDPQNNRVPPSTDGIPTLYITFDDGSTYLTPTLLDVLDQYPDVQFTFFVNCTEQVPGTFERILNSGHALASHTCRHPEMNKLTHAQRIAEFVDLQNFVNARIEPDLYLTCYRPGYGATNDSVRASAASLGLREWTWNTSADDYKLPGVEHILASLEGMRDGDIIVLHDSNGKWQSVEAVRLFLERHAHEYRFSALPDCATRQQLPPETWNGTFWDDDSSSFESDIEWLYSQGVTRGCGEATYCPNDEVTRAQMASFLTRAFNLPATASDFFSDDGTSSHHADINALAASGITRGCSASEFCPDWPTTRAQAASFIVRTLKLHPLKLTTSTMTHCPVMKPTSTPWRRPASRVAVRQPNSVQTER